MLLLFPSSALTTLFYILNSWSPGWETYNISVPFTGTYFSLSCYLQIQNWILWKISLEYSQYNSYRTTEIVLSYLHLLFTFHTFKLLSKLTVYVVRYFPSVFMDLEREDITFSSTLSNSLSTRYKLCACANRMRTQGWVSQWLFGVVRGRYTPSVSEEFVKSS